MTQWRKSSRSNSTGGNCVEVANLDGNVGVRDSKNPDGPALILSTAEFGKAVDRIKRGALDPA